MYYRIYEISTISEYEYVSIIGNYNNVGEDDEEQALRDRGFDENSIRYALKDKQGTSFKSLNVSFHTKNNFKYPYFSYIITLFNQYKAGMLPFPGCLTEQPAKIIEIFDVLSQLQYEYEEKSRKKIEKESKKRERS